MSWNPAPSSNMNVDYKVTAISSLISQLKSFRGFSDLFKFKQKLNLESSLFYFHSVVTVFILFTGTMFLTMNQYFGQPIKCLTNSNDKTVDINLIQHYCWMEGVFSLPDPPNGRMVHHKLYPGARQYDELQEKPIYHRYYQWVYFILIIQAILFYFPRHLWKKTKSVKIRQLLNELECHILTYNEYDRCYFIQEIADLMHTGRSYFSCYFLLEIFYLLHLTAEIWFTNIFLSGSFITLGYEWLFAAHGHYEPSNDPLIRTFPRLAKCTFHTYGITGTVEVRDLLCFLPMNIVNEKLYIVLWFWFMFLFFLTLLLVSSRLLFLMPCYRIFYLRLLSPTTRKRNITILSNSLGSFFIAQLIAKNIKPSYFDALSDSLVDILSDEKGQREFTRKYNNILVSLNPMPNGTAKPSAPPLRDKKKKDKDKKPPNIGFIVNKDDCNKNEESTYTWPEADTGCNDNQNNDYSNNDTSNNQTTADDWNDDDWNPK